MDGTMDVKVSRKALSAVVIGAAAFAVTSVVLWPLAVARRLDGIGSPGRDRGVTKSR